MNQNNMNSKVGKTDPNTGAVYTSGTNLDQGVGATAGAVYTSGVNTSNMTSNVSAGINNTTSSMGSTGVGNSGVSNVQQIKQQLQSIEAQLRQSQSSGTVNQAYTDAANRLQDVFEILNNAN